MLSVFTIAPEPCTFELRECLEVYNNHHIPYTGHKRMFTSEQKHLLETGLVF